MTQCNYCRLEDIRRRAKISGEQVTTVSDPLADFDKGVAVFVHPKNVTGTGARLALNPDGERKYFAAWFAGVPSSCRC